MKNLLLIYNPLAGDKNFKYALDAVTQVWQDSGYAVRLLRVPVQGDTEGAIAAIAPDCDAVVVAGGDGSINTVANALMRCGQAGRPVPPLGIIPAGTANDFAAYLKIPKDPVAAAEVIAEGRILRTDLGLVNDHYFINVCGAGLFTNISQHIDAQFKDSLGMLAYYLKGIEQLQNIVPLPLRIITPEQTLDESLYLFIVLNSSGTGGLGRLSPGAMIDDGLLDFIGLRVENPRGISVLMELSALFFKLLKGDYQDDDNILFMRGDAFTVEPAYDTFPAAYRETDVDGERGPDMPVRITCVREALPIFVPVNYR